MTSEPKQPEFRLEAAKGDGDFASAMAIREVVFIEEQQVPSILERDEEDAKAFHALAYDKGHAVATGRLIPLSAPPAGAQGSWGRIGRMAVLKSHRGRHLGRMILDFLETEARRRGIESIMLHAQLYARDFYAKAGYAVVGDVFDEAGIPHVEMRKSLV